MKTKSPTRQTLKPWEQEDVALLARCVSIGLEQSEAAYMLGISLAEYEEACNLMLAPWRVPKAGERPCLSCETPFHSPNMTFVRVCDLCKTTEEWRYGEWVGKSMFNRGSKGSDHD